MSAIPNSPTKESYKANSRYGQSSDIFHLYSLNKPEVNPVPKHKRMTNRSSYDIIGMRDTNIIDASNPQVSRKKQIESNTIKSTVFSNEPLPSQKLRDTRTRQTSFVFGTDDNSEFIVHKQKNTNYNPNKYFNEPTAYERKIHQLYGHDGVKLNENESKPKHRKSSSIGTIEHENRINNPPTKECVNAKERKFQTFYNNNNLGETNYSKPEPFLNNNSTGSKYDSNKPGVYNHVEYLKSNIFNDPDKENTNNTMFAEKAPIVKKVDEENEKQKIIINRKKNLWKNQDEACFTNLDWRNEKLDKYFKQPLDKDVDVNAKERKMNQINGTDFQKGNDINNNNNKDDNDLQMRKDLEFIMHSNYPKENEAQIKKRLENVSSFQGKEFIAENQKYRNVNGNEIDRKIVNYELKNFKDLNQVNVSEIEKMFLRKGIHINNIRTEEFHRNEDNTKGKVVFSLRENNDDPKFNDKFNEIKDNLKNETGIDIIKVNQTKKKQL